MATIQIDRLLETCIKRGASDLHLHVGRPPVLRLHGRLRQLETKILDPEDTIALMKSITPDRAQQELQEQGGTDFGFEFGEAGRFRTAIYQERGHVSLTLRLIPSKLFTLDEIGLPPSVKELLHRPRGMFLVTGPTGSGKTTTLASMINHINERYDRHIITVEDPIEYYHSHKKSLISQREVGVDVPSFAEALRRALRQDPDVILVGELRDLETIESALRAAETGHLVFGTLHTSSAQGTVTRIVDQFPVDQQEQVRVQLADSMIACLCQALLPRKDVRGMIAAYEYLYINSAVSNMIRENKVFRIPSVIQTGKKMGMQLLDDHLFRMIAEGKVDEEDAIERAQTPTELQEKIEGFRQGRVAAPDAQEPAQPQPQPQQQQPAKANAK